MAQYPGIYEQPLATPAAEQQAVRTATTLLKAPTDTALEHFRHAAWYSRHADERAIANRAGWLWLRWRAMSEGGAL